MQLDPSQQVIESGLTPPGGIGVARYVCERIGPVLTRLNPKNRWACDFISLIEAFWVMPVLHVVCFRLRFDDSREKQICTVSATSP